MTALVRRHGTTRLVLRRDLPLVLGAAILLLAANGGFFRFGALTTLIWLMATGLAGIWAAQRPRTVQRLVVSYWPTLLLPLLVILSTFWSAVPVISLVEGIKMLLTVVISLIIVTRLSTRDIMLAVLIGFGGAVMLSLANMLTGALPPVYEVNGALLGIFTHKNILAKTVVWAGIAVVAVFALDRRTWVSVPIVAALFPLTFVAQSATGQVGFLFVGLMLLLLLMRRLPRGAGLVLPVLLLVSLALTAAIYQMTGGDLVNDALLALGKSPTLTGRTVIWSVGADVVRQSPIVGLGYDAFWNSPAYHAHVNFIAAFVDDRIASFHNSYVEITVGLGILGGFLTLTLVTMTIVRLLRAYLRDRTIEAAIWLSVVAAIAVLAVVETTFLNARSAHLMLFTMGWVKATQMFGSSRR